MIAAAATAVAMTRWLITTTGYGATGRTGLGKEGSEDCSGRTPWVTILAWFLKPLSLPLNADHAHYHSARLVTAVDPVGARVAVHSTIPTVVQHREGDAEHH